MSTNGLVVELIKDLPDGTFDKIGLYTNTIAKLSIREGKKHIDMKMLGFRADPVSAKVPRVSESSVKWINNILSFNYKKTSYSMNNIASYEIVDG